MTKYPKQTLENPKCHKCGRSTMVRCTESLNGNPTPEFAVYCNDGCGIYPGTEADTPDKAIISYKHAKNEQISSNMLAEFSPLTVKMTVATDKYLKAAKKLDEAARKALLILEDKELDESTANKNAREALGEYYHS